MKDRIRLCSSLRRHFDTGRFHWTAELEYPIWYTSSWHSGHVKITWDYAARLFDFSRFKEDQFVAMCKNGVDPDMAFLLSLEI